jgi:hypothetical protein
MKKSVIRIVTLVVLLGSALGCVSQSVTRGEPVGGMVQQHGGGQPEPFLPSGSYH